MKAGAMPHPKAENGRQPLELLHAFVADKGSLNKGTDAHHKSALENVKSIEKLMELYSHSTSSEAVENIEKTTKDEL